jgi:hypothetical protein
LSDADDSDDMAGRIQALQHLEFYDEIGRALCPEILAAILRKKSFDVDLAADQLEAVTAPKPCRTSIAGQWRIWDSITMSGEYTKVKPAEVEEFFEGIRDLVETLELKDKRGRDFCDDIIVGALCTAFSDPLEAADDLILEADRLHGRDSSSNLEAKRAAYRTLANRFTGEYWYCDNPLPVPWHSAGPRPRDFGCC